MNASTLKRYRRTRKPQAAHQIAKSSFSTMLHLVSGCKFLFHKFIELPIISQSATSSVGQPARERGTHLGDLVIAFEAHKETKEYRAAVRQSNGARRARHRVSQEIWWTQWAHTQGRKLFAQKKAGEIDVKDLDHDQQQMLKDFETGRSVAALDELLAQKKNPYKGVGAETACPSNS